MQADPLDVRLASAGRAGPRSCWSTPSRPRSWSRPARRRVAHLGARPGPRPAAAVGGEVGHAARVPGQVRRLQVDQVGHRLEHARPARRRRPAGRALARRPGRRPSSRHRRARRAAPRRARRTGRRAPGRAASPACLRTTRRADSTPCRRLNTSAGLASCTSRDGRQICSPRRWRGRPLPSHCSYACRTAVCTGSPSPICPTNCDPSVECVVRNSSRRRAERHRERWRPAWPAPPASRASRRAARRRRSPAPCSCRAPRSPRP